MVEKFCQNKVTNAQNNARIRRAEHDALEKEVKKLRVEVAVLKQQVANAITAEALSDELNAEVRERRPPGEDKGRTVLVPEKMFREMRGVCMLDAIRRGYYED